MFDYRAPEGRPRSCPPAACDAAPVPSGNTPAGRQKAMAARQKTFARFERQSRAKAISLNKSEVHGVWMTLRQYSERAGVTIDAASMRALNWKWERRKINAGARIILVPYDKVPGFKPIEPAETTHYVGTVESIPMDPPPALTLWQRILRWFR